MKVIDLLNKLYNMEEVPKKIKIGCSYLTLNKNKDNYIYEITDEYYGDELIHWYDLDTKVEIIEEDKPKILNDIRESYGLPRIENKKIQKLDIRNEKNSKNNWKWKVYGKEHSYNISTPQKIIADKINEIIDYLEENK